MLVARESGSRVGEILVLLVLDERWETHKRPGEVAYI